RDNGKLLPLRQKRLEKNTVTLYPPAKPIPRTVLVILCDHRGANDGLVLENQIRNRSPDVGETYVDPRVASARSDVVLKSVDQAQQVVVGVYVVPSAARTRTVARGQRHSASLPDSTSALLSRILARAADKTVVLAMGNPYLTEDFPGIQNYICAFSNATVSE